MPTFIVLMTSRIEVLPHAELPPVKTLAHDPADIIKSHRLTAEQIAVAVPVVTYDRRWTDKTINPWEIIAKEPWRHNEFDAERDGWIVEPLIAADKLPQWWKDAGDWPAKLVRDRMGDLMRYGYKPGGSINPAPKKLRKRKVVKV